MGEGVLNGNVCTFLQYEILDARDTLPIKRTYLDIITIRV